MILDVDESRLDDVEALGSTDQRGMLKALAGSGAQVREALTFSTDAGIARLADDGRPRAVVIASLGGSSVVADALDALTGQSSPVPVEALHAGTLPGWVGSVDLVVAVSLSGAAPQPLSVAAEAARRGCRLLTVGSAGSPLADVAAQARGIHVPLGRERRSSRASLWALLTPVLLAADALDLIDAPATALEAAADRLDEVSMRCRPSSESFVNPAKSLALDLAGSVPLVLGNGELAGVAARRAAAQLARNARHPAVHGTLPDDASALVATFDGPFARTVDDIFADPDEEGAAATRLRLLLLRDSPDQEEPEMARFGDVVRDTAAASGIAVSEIVAETGHPLERLAGLMVLTDFASVYLALALGLDPATSPHVADLKERITA
jgi:fructoselysine-6-P-deglycase FrlB-like protein